MSSDKREYLTPETVIIGPDGGVLARIDGPLWPPINAKVELDNSSREGVVSDVRLKIYTQHAVVCVTVEGAAEAVPGGGA